VEGFCSAHRIVHCLSAPEGVIAHGDVVGVVVKVHVRHEQAILVLFADVQGDGILFLSHRHQRYQRSPAW
jgi:hypothetical protein